MLVLFTVFALGFGSQTKTITILQTSDVHGMLLPYDYIADKETSSSLAQAATVIARERKAEPNLLLIDSGDITQGNSMQGNK